MMPSNTRSQLEGLLEIVPPPLSTMSSKAPQDPTARGGLNGTEEPAAVASTPRKSGGILGEVVPVVPVPGGGTQVSPADGTAAERDDGDSETEYRDAVEGYSGSTGSDVHGEEWDAGGGGEGGGGGGLDEVKRRCSLLEVSLRASRTEALMARRARDAAESTVREQRETLTVLRERGSELEARLAKEKEAGKVGFHAWMWNVAGRRGGGGRVEVWSICGCVLLWGVRFVYDEFVVSLVV